jgi:hypothetical protein
MYLDSDQNSPLQTIAPSQTLRIHLNNYCFCSSTPPAVQHRRVVQHACRHCVHWLAAIALTYCCILSTTLKVQSHHLLKIYQNSNAAAATCSAAMPCCSAGVQALCMLACLLAAFTLAYYSTFSSSLRIPIYPHQLMHILTLTEFKYSSTPPVVQHCCVVQQAAGTVYTGWLCTLAAFSLIYYNPFSTTLRIQIQQHPTCSAALPCC